MQLRQIVDEAHALASAIEDGERAKAIFSARQIAFLAMESKREPIARAASELSTAIRSEAVLSASTWWPALARLADAIGKAIDLRRGVDGPLSFDTTQLARHVKLRRTIRDLRARGITDVHEQARILRVGSRFLGDMLTGVAIPEVFARELEEVTHKRVGWMDEPVSTDDE